MVSFRWLGVAGVALSTAAQTLVVDPYFTRAPVWRLPGRVRSDSRLAAAHIRRADHVLVTHPHVDHVLDVPDVLRLTGAVGLGSPHTCRLLAGACVPAHQIREIRPWETLSLGEAQVQVLPVAHIRFFGLPVCSGSLPRDLRPPLRGFDYRMDQDFAFLIEWEGLRILIWSGVLPAPVPDVDVAFVNVSMDARPFWSMLPVTRPRLLIPTHWDNFFRPLDRPLRRSLLFPHCIRLDSFRERVARMLPESRVCVAELFRTYPLGVA
ncbi:MAG: MBL fold metallo-hydrolase [Anaerolineae bacterium]|nr:MBL fold metallo-hydrolase [Anaerolineae bacterium]